jgi:glutamine amidotransferase
MTIDFAAETTNKDVVSIVATQPLTSDEAWEVYQPGEWRLWQSGETVASGNIAKIKE